jgi:hypothetical protein
MWFVTLTLSCLVICGFEFPDSIQFTNVFDSYQTCVDSMQTYILTGEFYQDFHKNLPQIDIEKLKFTINCIESI